MKNYNEINKKSLLKETIFALIAGVLGIVLVSFFTHNWNFIALIKSFSLPLLILSFLMMVANWFIEAYVILIIASMLDYKVPFRQCLKIFLIGGFFTRITPFEGGGGEPFQVLLLSRENHIKAGDSTAIIAIKTFIGSFVRISVFLLLPVWLIIAKPSWVLSITVNILINTGITLSIILFSFLIVGLVRPDLASKLFEKILQVKWLKKIIPENKIKSAIEGLKKLMEDFTLAKNKIFKSDPSKIYLAFVWSFISWGLVLFTPVILMRGLGVTSPWPEIIITAIIFYIASAYIPTPGGSGAAEIEMLALFARLIPQPLIGVFIITWRLVSHYFLLLIGGIATLRNVRKKPNQ